MGKADLHLHTTVSDGMYSVEKLLEFAEHEAGLDVLAVTDHEDARGGLRARELAAKRGYRLEVVVGAEVTTRQGHLLALFIEDSPKSFRSVESTLEAVHAMGGLAVVPHPLSWLTRSISGRTIGRIQGRGEPGVTFDGIELCNPSPAGRATRARAIAANETWQLPVTGGSDAHHLPHVGSGWTEFEGTTAADLRAALTAGTTAGRMSRYASLREVGIGATALGLAWGYSATPRKMLRGLGQGRRA
ncbi:MAG: PHP domain-containing protein [Dehalococcoidia bacterium]|nr:PHP domain-containing protein [Dehalococcoidia bacterium]